MSPFRTRVSLQENPVGLSAQLREDGGRSIGRVGNETEAGLGRRPTECRLVLLEEATEAVICVQDGGLALDRPPPAQLVGNRGRNRGAQRKGVRLLGKVPKVDIDNQRGLCLLEIDGEGAVFGQRRRPEDAIGRKAGIICVDLFRGVNLTLVEVKS